MNYSIEKKQRKNVKGYRFFLLATKCFSKNGKKPIDIVTITGTDTLKIALKEAVKKTVEATGSFIGGKVS